MKTIQIYYSMYHKYFDMSALFKFISFCLDSETLTSPNKTGSVWRMKVKFCFALVRNIMYTMWR